MVVIFSFTYFYKGGLPPTMQSKNNKTSQNLNIITSADAHDAPAAGAFPVFLGWNQGLFFYMEEKVTK